MYCKHCGKFIDDDSTFCQHCGRSLARNVVDEAQDRDHEPELTSSVFDYVEESTPSYLEDKPRSKKTGIILLVTLIILIAALAVVIFFLLRPASDSDDPYQDLSDADDPSAPNVPTQPDSSGSTNTPSIITNQMGNTPENYVTGNFRTVSYGNTVYHSYNSDMQFMAYDITSKTTTPLGIYGHSPSFWSGKLYYISSTHSQLTCYDISTKSFSLVTLDRQIHSVSKVFVTENGILTEHSGGFTLFDFDGKTIFTSDNSPVNSTLINADNYVYSTHKSSELIVFNLKTLQKASVVLGKECSKWHYFDGVFHLDPMIDSKTGLFNLYNLEYKELDNYGTQFFPYGNIFVLSTAQNIAVSSSDGSNYTTVSEEYYGMDNVAVTSDGLVYCTLHSIKDSNTLIDHTEYFCTFNINGSGLTILDSKHTDYSGFSQ